MRYTTSIVILKCDEVTGIVNSHVCAPQQALTTITAIHTVEALVKVHGPYYSHDAVRASVLDKYGRERWTMEINRQRYIDWHEQLPAAT